MFLSQLILLLIVVTSFLYIKFILTNRRLLLFFPLLLITPWFWMLFFGEPPISHLINIKGEGSILLSNIDLVLSYKYLFFEGESTLFSIVGSHGYFLLSFITLIITGIWICVNSNQATLRKLAVLLPISIITSALLVNLLGFLSFYLFLPILSLFATIGLLKFIDYLKTKNGIFIRALIYINFLLIFYEAFRLIRVIQVQMGILNA